MWIKICGTTNREDALAAVEAGADALGFIFAPSPRRIAPDVAVPIISALPDAVEKIGVFVDESPERIVDIAEQTGLTGVQLHGDEPIEDAQKLQAGARGRRLRLIRVLHMKAAGEMEFAATRKLGQYYDALLVDSGGHGESDRTEPRGGTGRVFDWDDASRTVNLLRVNSKIIVAGGLTPLNVSEAVRRFQPWGVDVASGVEREPGKKDIEKLKAFVAVAKEGKR